MVRCEKVATFDEVLVGLWLVEAAEDGPDGRYSGGDGLEEEGGAAFGGGGGTPRVVVGVVGQY